ncbi:MAG: helix-turn-helix domain-containing protein [Actinomycetaceae bacterium]|nr:helix-turn-helix domain-containing protein [Actinomycetaceae bacterium]
MAPRSPAEWLKFRRGAAGLDHHELARKSGVSHAIIAAIEAGDCQPSAAVWAGLREALALRPSVLLHHAEAEVQEIVASYGCDRLRVFGSVARGTDDLHSDIDLVLRFPESADIVTLLEMEERLSDLLTVSIDIVAEPIPFETVQAPLRKVVVE